MTTRMVAGLVFAVLSLAEISGQQPARPVVPPPTVAPDKQAQPPEVQIFVPGFVVRRLPIKLTNLVNVEYADDARLFAAGYDGRLHVLRDTDGDGLEDKVDTFQPKTSDDYPLGMVVRGDSVYVLFKTEIVRFQDTNGDGTPDKRDVAVKNWDDPKLENHPLLHRRRVDFGMGLAIAPDGSIYMGVGNAAYDNAYMIDHAGKLGDKNLSHYRPYSRRGCVLKFSPDGKMQSQVVTGVRYLMAMQFDQFGELFATDQEGATWMPNGNPFDELLHLQPGRHYGFPPSHPKYLPDLIDEPSVWDFAPQHQSICGFRFNGPVGQSRKTGKIEANQPTFGPKHWHQDAFLAGYSRGKLYRTKLIATGAGYLGHTQLVGQLQSLFADLSISPKGQMVLASHSGNPDWGTGPSGTGFLYQLSFRQNDIPQPISAWSTSPSELEIAFDRPLDPKNLRGIASQIKLELGRPVDAGDRLETIRPGYEVVRRQVTDPRQNIVPISVSLANDRRTLRVTHSANTLAAGLSIKLPNVCRSAGDSDANAPDQVVQEQAIDLLVERHGVDVQWTDNKDQWSGWLPHLDYGISRSLLAGSAPHQRLFDLIKQPGHMMMRGQLDLWQMLQPAIQPGSKLDYERNKEKVTLEFQSNSPFTVMLINDRDTQRQTSQLVQGKHRISVTVANVTARWLSFTLQRETKPTDEPLQITWYTDRDARPRAFPLRRFLPLWAQPLPDTGSIEQKRQAIPQLAGGDRKRGQEVFMGTTARCGQCHQAHGQGTKIGPDLSNLVHRDFASVVKDLLEPSAAINPDYLPYLFVMHDGSERTGIIHREDKEQLTIVDQQGKEHTIARRDVANTKPSSVSIMPNDLAKQLNRAQLRDLLTFLMTPPEEPKK